MSTTYLEIGLRWNQREVFSAAEAPAGASEEQRTLRAGANGHNGVLGPTTTPKVDKPAISREITLAGATTIDLTAIAALVLPSGATRTVDLTGAKPKGVLIRTKSTNNAAGVNIAPGAANPFPLFGAGNDITLFPDCVLVLFFRGTEPPAGIPAVAGGAKNIDLTPGAAGDVIWFEPIFGT